MCATDLLTSLAGLCVFIELEMFVSTSPRWTSDHLEKGESPHHLAITDCYKCEKHTVTIVTYICDTSRTLQLNTVAECFLESGASHAE